jgi:hypothetical protein
MAKAIPIPIPLNGLNTVNPDLPLEAGYARELTNYSIINGRLRVRPSVFNYKQGTDDVGGNGSITGTIWMTIGASTATSYTISYNGNVLRMSDSAVMATFASSIINSRQPYVVKHLSLSLVISVLEPRLSDYPFTAWTFTTIGITANLITSACSYKGRLYVCDGSTIEYSNVGQITGAMYDSFAISEFMDGQKVVGLYSVNLSGNTAENIFVILGDNGKVLVYQGDYPASSTWNLIGNHNMPRLSSAVTTSGVTSGAASVLDLESDLWIMTKEYLYKFSDLMQGGASYAKENSPSAAVENLWRNQDAGSSPNANTLPFCFYLKELDACVFAFPDGVGDDLWAEYSDLGFGQNGLLVYFRKYKAWALWMSIKVNYPAIVYSGTGETYIGSGLNSNSGSLTGKWNVYRLATRSNSTNILYDVFSDPPYTTDFTAITTSWKTPFINAFAGRMQKVCGVRPFFQSAINGYLEKIRIIFDYTDYNSPFGFYTQPTVTQINPGNFADAQADIPTQTWDNYNPFVSVAGAGGGVSLQITQQSKSGVSVTTQQLNEIYSATLYIEDGGDMI